MVKLTSECSCEGSCNQFLQHAKIRSLIVISFCLGLPCLRDFLSSKNVETKLFSIATLGFVLIAGSDSNAASLPRATGCKNTIQ